MPSILNSDILTAVDIDAFATGCRETLEKHASIAGGIGKVLNWTMPETTKNFIAPAWHGVQKYNAQPGGWSFDGMMNAAGKGVEGDRTQGFVNQAKEYGIPLKTDQYGALQPGNPVDVKNIDWMTGIKRVGSQALNWLKNDGLQWAKDNPWKLAGGGALALGGGYLLKNLLGGRQQENPQVQVINNNSSRFNPEYAPTSMAKYGEFGPSGMLASSMNLPYAMASRLAGAAEQPQLQQLQQLPQPPPKPNIHAEDPRLEKLLQNPHMRAYIEDLISTQ